MNKKSILLRSFMSIRTYAILAVFAVVLAILLFSAGCTGDAATKSSSTEPVRRFCSYATDAAEQNTAYQHHAKYEIKKWNLR